MLASKGLMASSAVEPIFVDDVFSTWLYTGNGSTQTITNGIDLAGEGGLVWCKSRSNANSHILTDTARGVANTLATNSTAAQNALESNSLSSFNSNGFSLNASFRINQNGDPTASWTFRKAPKFFDVVTYTGTGSARTVAHNLGSVPGMIIVKSITSAEQWRVYHRSLTSSAYALALNSTGAENNGVNYWNSTAPTSSVFSLGDYDGVNQSGQTYVAYLFAHDAGGFGESGTDSAVSCGIFTGNTTVNLGFEPQWILLKNSLAAEDWYIHDNMRGWPVSGDAKVLYPNLSSAEGSTSQIYPNATGFSTLIGGGTYIYLAIRRPNKPPTIGTQVFIPVAGNGSATIPAYVTNFPVDAGITSISRTGSTDKLFTSRLTGTTGSYTNSNDVYFNENDVVYDSNVGYMKGGWGTVNGFSWAFSRAPKFFDVVCYTGDGTTSRVISHNLQASPELVISKSRNSSNDWRVASSYIGFGATQALALNSNGAVNITARPVESVSNSSLTLSLIGANVSATTYVTYLFATLSGISKVGSYTGTGTTLQINCGFTTGARFVLIKATSTTGNWFVWDTTRGIISGNDPYLTLNTTAAEVTNTDWVDPLASGFELSNAGGNLVNTNGVSYIFLAVA